MDRRLIEGTKCLAQNTKAQQRLRMRELAVSEGGPYGLAPPQHSLTALWTLPLSAHVPALDPYYAIAALVQRFASRIKIQMLISLMDKERRTTSRVSFVAHAEINEVGASVSIDARVSDISRDGCYVDLRSALPQGTSVRIRIRTTTESFEASAIVGYTHPHLGMGLIFSEINSESQAVLQKWIAFAAHEQSDGVGTWSY